MIKKELLVLKKNFDRKLKNITSILDLDNLYRNFFSHNGDFTMLMKKAVKTTSLENKKIIMPQLNNIKKNLINEINLKKKEFYLKEIEIKMKKNKVFLGQCNEISKSGFFHPNSLVINKINTFLKSKSFSLVNHSFIENSKYNFIRLNVDENHPAFASNDTFFLDKQKKWLLRAHCTSSTARLLEKNKNKEFSSYTVGSVFRRDTDDSTHTHQFIQLDLVRVLKNSNIWEYQSFLRELITYILDENVQIRFRPSYFPFTSPSFELDIKCKIKAKYCPICKNTGWIELLGAGMLHQDVFLKAGYSLEYIKKNKIVGWAFGMGIDRLSCIVYKIPDTRWFYENRLQFLKYFKKGN